MSMTNDQLETALAALTARVNVIDGQNLTAPTEGALTQISKKHEGLKTDLKQSVNKLEQILGDYKKTVTGYVTMVKALLGAS